jgi:lysyl endopeptidase
MAEGALMRRTLAWVVGLAATVACSGVAVASTPERTADNPITGRELVGTVELVHEVLDGADQRRIFRYPGASYVKVHFSRLVLLPGDHVTVADPAGQDIQRYGSTERSVTGRWAMSVEGDTAVVTLHRTALGGLVDTVGSAAVDRVARGLRPAERPRRPKPPRRPESICGSDEKADAICYKSSDPTAYHRSKAVARLLINGIELCTAWRLGPLNRMLTNNHCLAETVDAHNTEVWFNYMCVTCGGYEVFRPTKVWGDEVLATDEVLDYTLFTVENFAVVERFGYLELDLRRPKPDEELYIPQHPGGDPTQLAIGGNCAVDDPSYEGYDTATDISYYCDTAGGSSGSPVLLASSDKVVALHHFGGCPNSGVRVDLIQRDIAELL